VIAYADSSALVKLYVEESGSSAAREALAGVDWTLARHTYVEVRRAVAAALGGEELAVTRARFEHDWKRSWVVELDEPTCAIAAEIAEETGLRTLDALHVAAAARRPGLSTFVTFDRRQGEVARTLGLDVRGVE
jgi:predicted nucleic acid-binding protein